MAITNVIFNNDKSALVDWNLVLLSASIPLPTPKRVTVDIKGMDGLLDLSSVLTGDIQYNNRAIKLTFELMDIENYYDTISEISNYLHGQQVTAMLTNDDHYYYSGIATISEWQCSRNRGQIVIDIDAEPYKYELIKTVYNIPITDTVKVQLLNFRQKVCPELEVTGSVTMTWKGTDYALEEGNLQVAEFILDEGHNDVTFKGSGTVKVSYRKGSL